MVRLLWLVPAIPLASALTLVAKDCRMAWDLLDRRLFSRFLARFNLFSACSARLWRLYTSALEMVRR
jgi:hypothetical protein